MSIEAQAQRWEASNEGFANKSASPPTSSYPRVAAISPTAPVPEPSSSTDRWLSTWAPSPENPGVSRYLERTMAASQTTQPTPPVPYCCSRNTVPSLFSKTRTKFRNGSSTEDSRGAAIAARQQDLRAAQSDVIFRRTIPAATPCEWPSAS